MKNIYSTFILILILSVKANSQVIFQKTIGGSNGEGASCVKKTFDGGYVLVGGTSSFTGRGNGYVVKTDSMVNITWARYYENHYRNGFIDIVQNADSGYTMVGRADSISPGRFFIYVVRIDKNGNTLWANMYGADHEQNAYAIETTADGGYLICGWASGMGIYGNIYVVRLSGNGNLVSAEWSGTYSDSGYDLEKTRDGGFIILANNNMNQNYLFKVDSAVTNMWGKSINGGFGNSVKQTNDNGYAMLGTTASNDIYFVKLDSVGNLLWAKSYGGTSNESGYSFSQTFDGGYIISGNTQSFGQTMGSVYLVRTNESGNVIWSKTYGGSVYSYGRSVIETDDHGFLITGSIDNFLTDNDIYVIKTDSLGNSGCNQTDVNTIESIINPAIQNASYNGGMPAGISIQTFSNPSQGGIATTLCLSLNETENISSNSLEIYPNPVSDHLTISYPENASLLALKIYNLTGENIFNTSFLTKTDLDVKDLPEGIYIIEILDQRSIMRQKFIKQNK